MKELDDYRFETLFHTDENLVVKTRRVPWRKTSTRTLLTRTDKMEEAIWEVVNHGLEKRNINQWQGLFYVMGKGQLPDFTPLYIGTVEKAGNTSQINTNFSQSHLAHWGDGMDYHIGDLSNAIFEDAPSRVKPNFLRWAKELFASLDTLELKEEVYLFIAPWWEDSTSPSGVRCSLRELRKEFVKTAGAKLRLVGRSE